MTDVTIKLTSSPSDKNASPEEPIPLQNGGRGITAADFEANLKKLCTFKTVQSFWEYFNNVPGPKEIPQKSSMHLMQDGIKPLWEDPRNASGGFWAIRIYKSDSPGAWNDLVLAAIGDQFQPYLQEGDEVNGVTVSIRYALGNASRLVVPLIESAGYIHDISLSDDIIQVWNRNAAEEAQNKLFKRIKQIVPNLRMIASYYKPCQQHQSFEASAVKK